MKIKSSGLTVEEFIDNFSSEFDELKVFFASISELRKNKESPFTNSLAEKLDEFFEDGILQQLVVVLRGTGFEESLFSSEKFWGDYYRNYVKTEKDYLDLFLSMCRVFIKKKKLFNDILEDLYEMKKRLDYPSYVYAYDQLYNNGKSYYANYINLSIRFSEVLISVWAGAKSIYAMTQEITNIFYDKIDPKDLDMKNDEAIAELARQIREKDSRYKGIRY